MKKNILFFIFMFIVSGCASTDPYSYREIPVASRRFLSLRQIYVGMTRQEVASVLGSQVIVGYEIHDDTSDQYSPITVKNPYRQEEYVKGNKIYNIDYYFVGIDTADGTISDQELAPLVFVKDQLMGYGWDYLNKKVKN